MFLSRRIAELLGGATLHPLRSSRYEFRSALGGLTMHFRLTATICYCHWPRNLHISLRLDLEMWGCRWSVYTFCFVNHVHHS